MGSRSCFGFGDTYLLKLDQSGNVEWLQNYDIGYISASPVSVEQTDDGGYAVAGFAMTDTSIFGTLKGFLLRTDNAGIVLWTKSYSFTTDECRFYSVKQTADGGFILCGYSGAIMTHDIAVIKTDLNGNLEWGKTFGGSREETAFDIELTNDGGYIITGRTASLGNIGTHDIYLAKLDSTGNQQWFKAYVDDNLFLGSSGWGNCVKQTQDNGFVLVAEGWTVGMQGALMLKTDSNGNLQWSKNYGIPGDVGFSLQQTNDGGYAVTGWTKAFSTGDSTDVFLLKTDSIGILQWSKIYGGIQDDGGVYVCQTNDNGYAIIGGTSDFSQGLSDAYIIKTDSNGNTFCTDSIVNILVKDSLVSLTDTIWPALSGGTSDSLININIIDVFKDSVICEAGQAIEQELAIQETVIIYPNPTAGQFTVSSRQGAKVYIYDIFGRLIEQLTINNGQLTIDITQHPKGIYLIKVIQGEEIFIQKLAHQ